MDNQEQTTQPELVDTSISAIASRMDVEKYEAEAEGKAPPRGDDGRFQKREAQAEEDVDAEPSKTVDAAPDDEEAEEVRSAEPEEDDDEEFIERVIGEGEDAQTERYRVSELLEAHERAQQMESEIERLQQYNLPPEEFEQATDQRLQYNQQLQRDIQQWQHAIKSLYQYPSEELINPQSQHYNPELYHVMLQEARQKESELQHAWQVMEAAKQEQQALERERSAINQQRFERKAIEIWPELKSQAARMQAVSDLEQYYGLTPEDIQSVQDPRLVSIWKDAIAHRKSQATAKKVAKVVAAKPKLVRSKGRGAETSKQRQVSQARKRLQQSNSLADAAAAIGTYLD